VTGRKVRRLADEGQPRGRPELQRVEQIDRDHQGLQLVVAVRSLADDLQEQVELGGGGHDQAVRSGTERRIEPRRNRGAGVGHGAASGVRLAATGERPFRGFSSESFRAAGKS